jgi:hypothetical protein
MSAFAALAARAGEILETKNENKYLARTASPSLSTLAWPYFAQSRAVHAFWYRYARFKRTGERAHCPCGLPLLVYPCLAVFCPVPCGSRILVPVCPLQKNGGAGTLPVRPPLTCLPLLGRILPSPARFTHSGTGMPASKERGSGHAARTASPYLSYPCLAVFCSVPRGSHILVTVCPLQEERGAGTLPVRPPFLRRYLTAC